MFCQSETDLPFEPESATPYRFLANVNLCLPVIRLIYYYLVFVHNLRFICFQSQARLLIKYTEKPKRNLSAMPYIYLACNNVTVFYAL